MRFSLYFQNAKLLRTFIFILIAISLGGCGGSGPGSEAPTVTPTVNWAKTFGGGNRDVAHSIVQTSDGGFIIAGETDSFGAGNADVWILKINANGLIEWEKTYGGSAYDIVRSIQQTSDDGFIAAGETSSFSFAADTDVWVLKLGANGNTLWQYRYGGNGIDKAYCIRQTSDGGYIVAGETNSFGAAGIDVWVLKLKSDGDIEWEKRYGGAGDDVAHSIQQTTSDGGYIVAGETSSFGAGDIDVWALKLDSNGGIEWQKRYGGGGDDMAHSIQQTSDGGYIVAGETDFFVIVFADFWVLKLDSNGVVEWEKTYRGSFGDKAYSIHQTSNGGYIIAGKTSPNPVNADIWVLKLDSIGDIEWQKTYGGNGSNSANFIRQTSDLGFIVAGETSFVGAGNADVWVLKLDTNGEIGSGCTVIGTSNATVTTTGVTAVDSSGIVADTTASITATSVSPQDSGATPGTQCSSP